MSVPLPDRDYFATHYAARSWRFYLPVIAAVRRAARPGPILDVGAGTGLLVEAALKEGLDCVGIEGSADAIAMGRTRCPAAVLTRHDLNERLPFPACRFEAVIVNQVIEHLSLDAARRLMTDVARVLRPGGVVYVASPCRHDAAAWREDPTHVHLFAPSELRALLADAGFSDVRSQDLPAPFLGRGAAARFLARVVFRLWPRDRWSATATCLARA